MSRQWPSSPPRRVLAVAGIAWFAHVLRRGRLPSWRPRTSRSRQVVYRVTVLRPAQALSARRLPAIEAPEAGETV